MSPLKLITQPDTNESENLTDRFYNRSDTQDGNGVGSGWFGRCTNRIVFYRPYSEASTPFRGTRMLLGGITV